MLGDNGHREPLWAWCRWHSVAWSETGERLPLDEYVERFGREGDLPVRDCEEDHGIRGDRVPVSFCPTCHIQQILLPGVEGYMIPPHEFEGASCPDSNALIGTPAQWRSAADIRLEQAEHGI